MVPRQAEIVRKEVNAAIIEMRHPRPKEICISATDAAAILGVWTGAVLKLCANEELRAWRISPKGNWHIVLDSVREYVAKKSGLGKAKA